MAIAAALKYLDYDDDGKPEGMHVHRNHYDPGSIDNIQDLLLKWLPDALSGGYQGFIDNYRLSEVLGAEEIEALFTNQSAYMGKELAGLFSILVPPEHSSWIKVRNMFEREAKASGAEIEISAAVKHTYLDKLIESSGMDFQFKDMLRLYRRANLFIQKDLADKIGVSRKAINNWELGIHFPNVATLHKLCDALKVNMSTRMLMLEHTAKDSSVKLENKNEQTWRKGFKGITGGGSIFGALLFHLRHEQNLTLKDLVDKTGFAKSSIRSWEDGIRVPNTAAKVHKLCDVLGVEENSMRRKLLLEVAECRRARGK